MGDVPEVPEKKDPSTPQIKAYSYASEFVMPGTTLPPESTPPDPAKGPGDGTGGEVIEDPKMLIKRFLNESRHWIQMASDELDKL